MLRLACSAVYFKQSGAKRQELHRYLRPTVLMKLTYFVHETATFTETQVYHGLAQVFAARAWRISVSAPNFFMVNSLG